MALSGVDEMVPVSEVAANIHVVTWKTPEAEAVGLATAIVENIHAHPTERHLAMVTRRDFGYSLREKIKELDPSLTVEIGFSEGLLESCGAREAFSPVLSAIGASVAQWNWPTTAPPLPAILSAPAQSPLSPAHADTAPPQCLGQPFE